MVTVFQIDESKQEKWDFSNLRIFSDVYFMLQKLIKNIFNFSGEAESTGMAWLYY